MARREYLGIDREKISWYPVIDEDLCTGCGACVDFCDNGVFELRDGKAVITDWLNCVVGCDKCAQVCPTGALTFPSKDSLREQVRELRGN